MTIQEYSVKTKNRFNKLTHVLLICTTLLKCCGVAHLVIVSLIISQEGILDKSVRPVFNVFIVNGMALGDASVGISYTLYFMLPLHTIFGCLGLLGAVCRNNVLCILYACFLLVALVIDVVFLCLSGLMIDAINSWIGESFTTYYADFNAGNLSLELTQAWNAMFVTMECCGTTGLSNCSGIPYTLGCWDKYSGSMNTYLWTFLTLMLISILNEVTGLITLELIYQRLDEKPRCSSGLYGQLFCFIQKSWKEKRSKVVFTFIHIIDSLASFALIVAGIITILSDFVSNSFLIPVFGTLRFYNYYLPDIFLGLGASMITIGIMNIVACSIGFNILCFKSEAKIKLIKVLQLFMVCVFVTEITFWSVVLGGVRADMYTQLWKEFLGYGSSWNEYYYTKSWHAIFVTFTCCKVQEVDFNSKFISSGVPEYCEVGRTPFNSDLYATNWFTINSNYNTEFCEDKIRNEVLKYQQIFLILCGLIFLVKLYNVWHMFLKERPSAHSGDWTSFFQKLRRLFSNRELARMWCFLVLGLVSILVISIAILINGAILRFDHLFGQNEIRNLFENIHVNGMNLLFWISSLAHVMISIGCITIGVHALGIQSAIFNHPAFYALTIIGGILSVFVKILGICTWIQVRVAIDWNLYKEVLSSLNNRFLTDNASHTDYFETVNLGFNFLFYEGKCCGVTSITDMSFSWTHAIQNALAPVTCYEEETSVRYYTPSALNHPEKNYTKGCLDVILATLHDYDIAGFVLFSISMLLEITVLVLLDRRYKHVISLDREKGAFSSCIHYIKGKSVNEHVGRPGLRKRILAFMCMSAFLMLTELLLWIGVLVGTFLPGYLQDGFLTDLRTLYSLGDYTGPNLGYLAYGLFVTLMVIELLYIIVHFATFLGIRTLRKKYVYMSAVALGMMVCFDLVTLTLAAYLLNLAAYNCRPESASFCLNHTDVLYNICGVFIGFNSAHIVILIVMIMICISTGRHDSVTLVTVLPINSTSLSVSSEHSTDRQPSVIQPPTDSTLLQIQSSSEGTPSTVNSSQDTKALEVQSSERRKSSPFVIPPSSERKLSVMSIENKSLTSKVPSDSESLANKTTLEVEYTTEDGSSAAKPPKEMRTDVGRLSTTDSNPGFKDKQNNEIDEDLETISA